MKRLLILSLLLTGFAILSLVSFTLHANQNTARAAPPDTTPTPAAPPEERQTESWRVKQAMLAAVRAQREQILAFLVYETDIVNVKISKDGLWATALIVSNDPQTGLPAHVEPGLALALRAGKDWRVILPAHPLWADSVKAAPIKILSEEHKAWWLKSFQDFQIARPAAPLTGYLLPWPGGTTRYLSRSVAHDEDIPDGSAHYAFDFYVAETGLEVWDLYAAKAGTIWLWKNNISTCWEYTCSDEQPLGNYLVLRDDTTSPPSFQAYLHMAFDSVPDELLVVGAPVAQRQFIGQADNTGQSWGSHLHIQVHTNPYSYWGYAVDITFDDVDINGGRPRVSADLPYCNPNDVCDQTQAAYTAGQGGDGIPPFGGLLEPYTGVTVNDSTVHLEGYAGDNESGLSTARFIAFYENAWRDIGDTFTDNFFELDWDLCADGVPDGAVSVGLEIMDNSGMHSVGPPGLTHFTKDYACPVTPACSPSTSQVALFADPNYGGLCTTFGVGNYAIGSLGAVGDDNTASLEVGANVYATLYGDDGTDYFGKDQAFAADDPNLADNPLTTDIASSLKVQSRTQSPSTPTQLLAPVNGLTFADNASLSLSWRNPGGAIEYQAKLDGPAETITSEWLSVLYWHLNPLTLTEGTYTWQVKARNSAGESDWSSTTYNFTIAAPIPAPTPVTAPFSDDVESGENGWTASGLWNRLDQANRAHSGSYSWYYGGVDGDGDGNPDYKDGTPNTGDLTSPPIFLPDDGSGYLLDFWYRYQTEGPAQHWDQRWVQISADGGPFENLLQLYQDPADYYLRGTVDLTPYAGSTVQVRFHFEALDGAMNYYEGWYVDDISIAAGDYPTCSDADDSPAQATLLSYGDTQSGVICPAGDVDYYKFNGAAGDRIAVDIDGPNPRPTDFDPILFLLDSDGASELAQSDDEVPGVLFDPHLGYLLPRAGTYYLELRQWAHPTSGGEDYTYTLTLLKDNADPIVAFDYPLSGSYLPDQPISLTATISDADSGIAYAEFLWHSADWENEGWTVLAKDTKAEDGWNASFDPTAYSEQAGAAFYLNAYDWAGNFVGQGVWEIGIDRTAPSSAMQPLSTTQNSTAVLLEWSSSDNISGVASYDLQSQKNGGAWTPALTTSLTQTWFIAEAAATYGFRLRAADVAGNLGDFPSSAEITTTIPNTATLCSSPDVWENDNASASATWLSGGDPAQTHNFCNPASADYLNDEDWLTFSAQVGQGYLIEVTPLSADTAVILELYAADGVTLLASVTPSAFGEATSLRWRTNDDGDFYLRLRHLDGGVIGNEVAYAVNMHQEYTLFLPILRR